MGFSSPFCPSSRISLRKKSRAILVGRGKGNVASVRFARRKAKAKGEKNERRRMDKRWTSFTHRRRTYLDEDGGTKTVLRCLSRQTRFKLAEFEFIPRLCSQFFLRFSKPISIFLFENRIFFNPLSNFLRSNNCPLFPNRVSRDKSFERRANLNNSFSPIVKLECNSTVNQNWCRVLYSRN